MMLDELTTVPQGALPMVNFREHLRLGTGFSDDGLQDDVLEAYLRAAIASIEARTGKILIARDFGWTVTAWREAERQPLPLAPVETIIRLVSIDEQGTEINVDPATFRLEPDPHRPMLVSNGTCLPRIPERGSMRLEVRAGFGVSFADIPNDLQQAVFVLASHFYENRSGAERSAFPFEVASLIERFKTVRLMLGRGGQ